MTFAFAFFMLILLNMHKPALSLRLSLRLHFFKKMEFPLSECGVP